MNQAIIKEVIKVFLLISIPFIIVKFLYLASFFYLEKKGVNHKVKNDVNFYEKFKFSKNFDLQLAKDAPPPTKVEAPKEVYKLVNVKLKAVYIADGNTFIAIEEKNKTEFIDLNADFNGYKLIAVELNRAVFDKDGKNYELMIDDKKLPEITEKEIVKENLYNIKRNIVKKFTNNFDEIWKHISIKEIKQNGVIQGFKIRYIKPKSIFNQIGLRAGDIITSVNNVRITSYAEAFKFYKKINKLDSLKITFIRDNEEKELEYEIN